MNKQIALLYKHARENENFLKDIESADNDREPSLIASSIEKHVFASTYYGWLVGKFGNKWRTELNK